MNIDESRNLISIFSGDVHSLLEMEYTSETKKEKSYLYFLFFI